MKKLISLVLVLMMLASVALAEIVPSKSTANMSTTVTIQTEVDIPEEIELVVAPVIDEVVHAEKIEQCLIEVEKLAACETVEEYFGEVKNVEGEIVSLKEILGAETLNVHEFMPVLVENYDVSYGKVKAVFQFATPYEVDEIVLVLIGVPGEVEGEIEWIALEGVVTEEGVQIEFDETTLETAQNTNVLMAVVSK